MGSTKPGEKERIVCLPEKPLLSTSSMILSLEIPCKSILLFE